MKLDTDDWMTLAEAITATGMPQKTLYRIADRLGLTVTIFGVRVLRRADLERLKAGRLPLGNPEWIGDGEKAGAAAAKAVESRRRRVAERGLTAAELRRNKRLAIIGATRGGRKPRGGGGA